MRTAPRALILALALASPPAATARAEESPAAPSGEAERLRAALAGLESPFYRERQAAALSLAALLPGSRALVHTAWRQGGDDVRSALAPVLGKDAGVESMAMLLDAWVRGSDALAAHARDALLDDPEAARAGLARARQAVPRPDAAPGSRGLDAIEQLLARDEVERLFLSRKSRSGGTGFYRGQYDVLRPRRELALEVCLQILTDRAMRMPGASAVGGYRFLRPVAQVLDVWEVRSMALNALLDLATPQDRSLILRMDSYLTELEERSDSEDEDVGPRREDPESEAFLDDLLATLYRLDPSRYESPLRFRYAELARGAGRFARGVNSARLAAGLALRAGWYAEAIDLYESLLPFSTSEAHDYYNMACAYASWSLDPGGKEPAELRANALRHLESSVAEHWSDLSWMEQDRDLDPIRDTARYRALRATIRARLGTDVGDQPPPPSPTPLAPAPGPVPAPSPASPPEAPRPPR